MWVLVLLFGFIEDVKFMGFVNLVYEEFSKLDVLMMILDYEGLLMILLEVLVMEVLVIVYWIGGILEVLVDGDCGWLVDE